MLLSAYVEFEDDVYQGSFYKLRYNPEKDMLVGEYYDAIQRITYHVEFTRKE
jgi:hypothetical protein